MKSSLFFDMKGLTVCIQSGLFLQGWVYDYQFMFSAMPLVSIHINLVVARKKNGAFIVMLYCRITRKTLNIHLPNRKI